jgi:secreted protein with Ig-like and vWFA domain
MRPVERHNSSYQVVVLGELGPAFLALCAPLRADSQTSSVFQLRAQDGQGIADLAAMLQAAGLMILSIRQVSVRETWAATGLSA